jgi:hypothetical protein
LYPFLESSATKKTERGKRSEELGKKKGREESIGA